jgi:hypothetical protein
MQSALGSAYEIIIAPSGSILVTTALGPLEVGPDGKSLTYPGPGSFGSSETAVSSVALQPDGRILFAGEKTVYGSNGLPSFRWMVGRVQSNGVAVPLLGPMAAPSGLTGPSRDMWALCCWIPAENYCPQGLCRAARTLSVARMRCSCGCKVMVRLMSISGTTGCC